MLFSNLNFNFLSKYGNLFLTGVLTTLALAACTVILGVIIGLIISLLRLSNVKPLSFLAKFSKSQDSGWLIKVSNFNPIRFIAVFYIEVIRGIPLLVLLLIIYYGLMPTGSGYEFIASVIALSINSSAYVAEIIRSGIQAVDVGQMEASRSLGMKYGLAMGRIVIPQAVKNILPALGNEFVVLIKESSIVYLVGNVYDIMYQTTIIRANTYRPIEPLLIAALIYLIITFTISKTLGAAERRMRRSERK